MLKKINVILFLLIINSSLNFCFSQNCTDNLKEAQKLYASGKLKEVPDKLIRCLESGFTREEQLDAYKIIIQSYLYEDMPADADKYMLAFLSNFPEYKLLSDDPEIFRYLYDTYNTMPVFAAGAMVGLNRSDVRIIELIDPQNPHSFPGKYSPSGAGFDAGINLNRRLYKNIDLEFEVLYSQSKILNLDTLNGCSVNFNTNFNNISIPLTATYNFYYKSFVPYLRFGTSFDYLIKATSSPTRDYIDRSKNPINSGNIILTNLYNKVNSHLIFGCGFRKLVPHSYIFMDARYYIGLTNYTYSGYLDLPETDQLRYEFHHLLDKISVNNMAVNIGWCYTFYKPKKKK